MALTPGTRLGVYTVTAQIGEGGMGQVYRARDTRLDRDVAIKVLPEAFAQDADRLARFQREARTLASLNHPHIAAIYGLEESGGVSALVMELVEGEDLSRRIARGALPLDEALPVAKQIAEALEAAHEQGIIHRDLKPANVKVRPDGTVKVLDFGLAKAGDRGSGIRDQGPGIGDQGSGNSAAITSPAMTMRGVILGSAAYMAPEQARGKAVDRRADLWAFGVVLYEMLAGRRAFPGEGSTDTMLVVVSQDPDWTALPPDTPASIRKLLRRCLEKDRTRRLDSATAARLEIEDALAAPAAGATTPAPAARVPLLPWALVATLLVALTGALLVWAPWQPTPVLPETRLEIVTPGAEDAASFALSPDGRQIVYLASGDGGSRLWLRSLATTTAQPLAETEDAREPFWSPDGRSIGFFAQGMLKRLDLLGGAPRTLAPAVGGRGGTWSADGSIVFAPAATTPLMRVSATGGTAVAVTVMGPQQLGHLYPHLLPDGRRFLFYAQGTPEVRGIYLGALDATAPVRLTSAESGGVFLPSGPGVADPASPAGRATSGWLLWGLAGTLVAQRLDLANAVLTGDPVTLSENVEVDGLLRTAVSVSSTRLVAYRTGAGSAQQLTWVDRSGKVSGTVGDRDANNQSNPRVSPDGRRVVVARTVQGNTDLWLLEGVRSSRLTFDAARDDRPAWSPDGTRVVFYSTRSGGGDIYQKLASGAAAEVLLPISDQPEVPNSWTADGRFLLYHRLDAQTGGTDLWVLPMLGARTPSVFRQTPLREAWGAFSPDDKWVAYYSNESGRTEIYIRPFVPPSRDASTDTLRPGSGPAPEGQWQVSTAGGVFPLWRPDGKELYYLSLTGTMMAVPITTAGATLEPGAPVALFRTRIYGGAVDLQLGRQYDVARDGRFLINAELDEAAPPITLLMNWNPEGKK